MTLRQANFEMRSAAASDGLTGLLNTTMFSEEQEALQFLTSVLDSSTEYSIVAIDLDGTIVLWNEGARRTYGYLPEEVVNNANFAVLHTPADVSARKPRGMMDAAVAEGRWECNLECVRRNGERFTARVVVTPRLDTIGSPIGFLIISKDISAEMRSARS